MVDKEARLNELRQTPRCGSNVNDREDGLDRVDGLIELMEFTKPNSVLEIGANLGVSTEIFLLYADRVTVVDPWLGDGRECRGGEPEFDSNDPSYLKFLDRTSPYASKLTVIRGYSPRDVANLSPASFDLVYIDAIHEYDAVRVDIQASRSLLKPGGWLTGHDYVTTDPTCQVLKAVDDEIGTPDKVFSDFSWAKQV